MMTHEQKTRLGIFLAVATVLFLAALGFFLVPKLREAGDVYYVNFRNTSVYGLDVDSVVTYQGMDIGKVLRMEVNPKSVDSVLVYIKIRKGFPIKTDTTAVLMYAGITGLKFVDLRGGTATAPRLPPGSEIQTGKGLEEIAGNIVSSLSTAATRFNSLLSDQNRAEFASFLQNIDKSSAALATVLDSKRTALENTISNIEKASADFVAVTANLQTITRNLDDMARKLTDNTEVALRNIADRFSEKEMGQVIQDFRAVLETAASAMKQIEGAVRSDQQDLKQALTGLNEAMDGLSRFAREISEDPTVLIRTRKEKKK
jgi:phospholipid/cholesterol/gamma-HCH transport system substrate-binding protein